MNSDTQGIRTVEFGQEFISQICIWLHIFVDI